MGVVLRGSVMRFKMALYECGFKRELNEIQTSRYGFLG